MQAVCDDLRLEVDLSWEHAGQLGALPPDGRLTKVDGPRLSIRLERLSVEPIEPEGHAADDGESAPCGGLAVQAGLRGDGLETPAPPTLGNPVQSRLVAR